MHPEWSIIILTVLAGIAEGLLAFLVAGDIRAATMGSNVSKETLTVGSALTVVLAGAGVLASFFHLHHKARGIKAIYQWRFSWLSREAILLPAFIGLAFLYGAASWFEIASEQRIVIGVVGVLTGFALAIASGMIYAAIPYIREWGNAYTPVNFLLIGLASGGAMAVSVFEFTGASSLITLSLLRLSFGVTVVAFIAKMMAYRFNATCYVSTDESSAIGVNNREVALLDMGAAYGHYNTKEYYHREGKKKASLLVWVVIALLFIAPLALLTYDYMPLFRGGSGYLAPYAALLMVAGAFLERWLFFIQGNHVQNLYYGLFPKKKQANPILQPGKKSAPLPPH